MTAIGIVPALLNNAKTANNVPSITNTFVPTQLAAAPTVNTPDKTGTIQAIANATFVVQTALAQSFTPTQPPTTIPTHPDTATVPPPPTTTFDPNRAAAGTFAARQAETANAVASYTKTLTPTFTPTPTFSLTPDYNQTATALVISENQTVAAIVNATDSANTAIAIASFTKTFTPTAPPFPTVTANNQWKSQTKAFNGVTMALVPPGCFLISSNPQKDSQAQSDEQPQTKICFSQPFWIDQTPVTQAQFKQFNGKAANASYFSGPNRRVEQITRFEAKAYCEQQRGARLPTEAEYEYAARGPDDLIYPWDNSFVAGDVVYSDNSGNQTADVGSKPGGKSWVGALDMSGNV